MPRMDIFTFIHKGIRAMLYEQGRILMQADFTNQEATTRDLDSLGLCLQRLQEHGDVEEAHVFPSMNDHTPELVNSMLDQHKSIHEKIAQVKSSASVFRDIQDMQIRIAAGDQLNREFNDLMAFYLAHMNREETEMVPATWQYLTDEMLGGIVSVIQRNTPPAALTDNLGWAIKSINNTELVGLLKGVRATAPSEMLEKVKDIAEKALPQDRWEYIKNAAGLN